MYATLVVTESHLSTYLRALNNSVSTSIKISSRWPWVTEVIMPYPNSLLDRLVLFIKTLRIYIPEKAKDQFLRHSIESLHIYKNAINYQLLAYKPRCLTIEKENLSNKILLDRLDQFEHALVNKYEVTSDQKESLREWAGFLADLHSPIRLDAILDFTQNTDILLGSIYDIKQKLQKRKKDLPNLINKAINEQMRFFMQDPLVNKKNVIRKPPFKQIQLFRYFVREEPCEEIISLCKQIDIAARLWNSSYKNKYRKSLIQFKLFFESVIEKYGAPWDIAHGMAYANLFNNI